MITDTFLHIASFSLVALIYLMLVVISFYMLHKRAYALQVKRLQSIYSNFISEIILSDSKEELKGVLEQPWVKTICEICMAKPLGRKVLIDELMNAAANLNGSAVENIKYLYRELGLYRDSLHQFDSHKWHLKAGAIKQLARMGNKPSLRRIYKETDNKNEFIRKEAQLAVVTLVGFNGLRFLGFINYSLTQWQQLCLLQELEEPVIKIENVSGWLQSRNPSVVEFSLRFIEKFRCVELHDAVVAKLKSGSLTTRIQALHTLREIAGENTTSSIISHFEGLTKQEKLEALSIISDDTNQEHFDFFSSLINQEDEQICIKCLEAMKKINPDWCKKFNSCIKDKAFVFHLNNLKKEVV